MRRRQFIAGLASTAASPILARAQQPPMLVVGFLSGIGSADAPALLAAFHKGLGEVGYFEKKNVVIEYRWAENQNDRLPVLARELVEHHVTAIVALGGTAPALAGTERRGAAALDRAHRLELAEAHVTAPSGPVVAEDVRDLQSWTGHVDRSGRRPSFGSVSRSSGLIKVRSRLVATWA